MRGRISRARVGQIEKQTIATETKGNRATFGICDLDGNVLRRRYDGGEVSFAETDVLIPEKLEPLLFPKKKKIVYGGRGSGKTRTIASILTERIRYDDRRVFCLREHMLSIQDSSHMELCDEARRRGVSGSQIYAGEKVFRSKVGKGRALYAGLQKNIINVKGKAGVDDSWVDEAENVSLNSWSVLEPTIRKAGSEQWISFNPRFESDPTWTEQVAPYVDKMVDGVYEDEHTLIIECNWRDNPWFTEELCVQKDKMKERDNDRYLWIWEGKFKQSSTEQVMGGKWMVDEFEPGDDWEGPFFGADFGFSQDPSTLVKMWIHDENLYIEREAYKVGVEISEMREFYNRIPGVDNNKIWADCARPETISHLKKQEKFNIEGAPKWTGSVEDGIAHVRMYKKIVIHRRCKWAVHEAINYKHKVDPLTEQILTDIIDKDNHIWDAVRYGLADKIQKPKKGFFS